MKQSYWLIDLDCDHGMGADWFPRQYRSRQPFGFLGDQQYMERSLPADQPRQQRVGEYCNYPHGPGPEEPPHGRSDLPPRMGLLRPGARLWRSARTPQDDSCRRQANMPKSSVADVFNVAINDFKTAEQLLFPAADSRSGEKGRVTRESSVCLSRQSLPDDGLRLFERRLPHGTRRTEDNAQYTYAKDVVAGL